MTVFVSLIRGINVGGHKAIKMEALRAIFESLGLESVRTHLQSGNVVFQSATSEAGSLERLIEGALLKSAGLDARVIVRTAAELKAIIEKNPLVAGPDRNPSHIVVMFLSAAPAVEAKAALVRVVKAPEEMRVVGREAYIYYGAGIARSKLSGTVIEKTLRVVGTGRNWNTVTRLLEIAEALERE